MYNRFFSYVLTYIPYVIYKLFNASTYILLAYISPVMQIF